MLAEYHDAVAETMSEKDLQAKVVELARTLGYRVYHTFDSRRSAYGFPDLMIVGHGRCIAMELKTQHGKLSDYQAAWLAELAAAAVETHVVRPSDWLDGTTECVLTVVTY